MRDETSPAPQSTDPRPNDSKHNQDLRCESTRPRELKAFRVSVSIPESGSLTSDDEIPGDGDADVQDGVPSALSHLPCPPPFPSQVPALADLRPPVEPPPVLVTAGEEESECEITESRLPRADTHPVVQSLTLIASMIVMLLIARFSVPRIVEEVRYSWHRGELRADYEMGSEGLKNVSLDSLSRAYEMVTSVVSPSVVHIEVTRRATAGDAQMRELLGAELFGMSDQGSGIVVDAEGYVLTNRHVIEGGESILLTLSDGRRLPARIVGTDPLTDLAVLKIEADRLMPIYWGDSDELRVGSPVWAVGSPFGLDRTITFGILSGKHRWVRAGEQYGADGRYQDFMQSDVAVNPGNSGGPLVDAKGTLVGINTAIVGDTYQGVSFSIPSNLSKQIYESIRKTGRVQRGYLGVKLLEVPDELLVGENTRVRGALIDQIAGPGSPGGMAGLMSGDKIQRADGVDIQDAGHLMRMVGAAGSETPMVLDVQRGDEKLQLTVNLGNRPFELDH